MLAFILIITNIVVALIYCFLNKETLPKNTKSVYIAGNIWKASTNLPSKTITSALCVPHPKHSIPRNFLLGHCNM